MTNKKAVNKNDAFTPDIVYCCVLSETGFTKAVSGASKKYLLVIFQEQNCKLQTANPEQVLLYTIPILQQICFK